MRKQKAITFEYVLETKEAEIIQKALIYAKHRLVQHKNTGARYIASLDQIERLLSELN